VGLMSSTDLRNLFLKWELVEQKETEATEQRKYHISSIFSADLCALCDLCV